MLNNNAKEHFSNYFGIDFAEPLQTLTLDKNPDKDLALADLHEPYGRDDLIKETVENNLDCNNLIVVGDLWDFYSKSHYRQKRDVDFRAEFRAGYYRLRYFAERFTKVYLMLANHDNRWLKYMFDHVPTNCLEFIYQDLLVDLIKTIPNVEIVSQKAGERNIEYIWQYKDVVFSHVEQSNVDITKSVQEVKKKLDKWERLYGIKDYKALIQAHNHQSGRIRIDGKTLYQIPCLIDINKFAFDYVFDGKMKGNPPSLGYMVLIFDEGFNSNKTILYDY